LTLTSTLSSLSASLARNPDTGVFLFNKSTKLTRVVAATAIMDDSIVFNGDLKISFRRTIRVPDNDESHFLPPDLGAFPLKAVSQHSSKLDPAMVQKGGVFFPMYRKCSTKWVSCGTPS
jgi:hypothetical protein